jgi:hypothetical protein
MVSSATTIGAQVWDGALPKARFEFSEAGSEVYREPTAL